jgi:hypothetical protein
MPDTAGAPVNVDGAPVHTYQQNGYAYLPGDHRLACDHDGLTRLPLGIRAGRRVVAG